MKKSVQSLYKFYNLRIWIGRSNISNETISQIFLGATWPVNLGLLMDTYPFTTQLLEPIAKYFEIKIYINEATI
jgi:hypothetical protein